MRIVLSVLSDFAVNMLAVYFASLVFVLLGGCCCSASPTRGAVGCFVVNYCSISCAYALVLMCFG